MSKPVIKIIRKALVQSSRGHAFFFFWARYQEAMLGHLACWQIQIQHHLLYWLAFIILAFTIAN